MQIILKIVFTVGVLFVALVLLGLTNIPGYGGALPMMIIGLATFAGIRAVWKYKSKEKEVSSNMPKLDKGA
ncbi:hypothetical protein A9Q83_04175 [Alphaproteobacteria bacterium 46_93_T64]|nr:hypothetical protein A9Q83_04175 [Alphaproteobacteria bacterium 46_93_T64]